MAINVQDLLVYYTNATLARLGPTTIRLLVDAQIATANQAYVASLVDNLAVRLLALEPSPIQEASAGSLQLQRTKNNLVANATAIARRNSIGADHVVLLCEATGADGDASLQWAWSGAQLTSTLLVLECFAVLRSAAMELYPFLLAHELGHAQGCAHDRTTEGGGVSGLYHYGYRNCNAGGIRDIMSYACPTFPNVAPSGYFSNPLITVGGVPLGVDPVTNPAQGAYTARTLRETAPHIANFRTATIAPPPPLDPPPTAATRTLRVRAVPRPSRVELPGHYLSMGNGSGRRTTYWKPVSGQPNLLTQAGLKGIHVRFPWGDLETGPGSYVFGPIKSTYADSERSIRAELWRCQQNNSQLVLMPEDRTFDNTNPAPADMAGNPNYVRFVTTGTGGGYSMIRWNPDVVARWRQLISALGAAFGSHPNFFAIAFQETATGLTATDRDETGYTDVKYRDAIIGNLKASSDAFRLRQTFWFTNYFPTPATDYRLEEVADAIKGYNGGDSGVVMGGPDILPDDTALASRVYPRFGAPPVGSWGELKLANSMQFDSYAHLHTTASTNASPDPRLPNDRWQVGDLWTMDQLYRWGVKDLHLDYVFWNFDVSGAQTYSPDATNVIAANPTWTVPGP